MQHVTRTTWMTFTGETEREVCVMYFVSTWDSWLAVYYNTIIMVSGEAAHTWCHRPAQTTASASSPSLFSHSTVSFQSRSSDTTTRRESKHRRCFVFAGPVLRFESPPQHLEVKAGETARLTCCFVGNPPVVSRWIRNKEQVRRFKG